MEELSNNSHQHPVVQRFWRPSAGFVFALLLIFMGAWWWVMWGGKWWWYFNVIHSNMSRVPDRQEYLPPPWLRYNSTVTAYDNRIYGFEIKLVPPWRLANEWSRKLSSLREAARYFDDDGEAARRCTGDANCRRFLEPKLEQYFQSWTAYTSDVIVFTDLNESDEQQFLLMIDRHEGTLQNLPRGHWIEMFPTEVTLHSDKETPPTTPIQVRLRQLQNGDTIREVDQRAIGGNLAEILPHEFSATLGSMNLHSLELLTSVLPHSELERGFYKMLDSIQFK